MSEIIQWLYDSGVVRDIVSDVIVAVIIATLAFIFRNTIIAFIKRILPRLASKTPHINFEVRNSLDKTGEWQSNVIVSNAGDEPAYNVYVFYFEQFSEGNFTLRASNMDSMISRPVLGIRDSLEFNTTGVHFDGCSATCKQEIWIEYENTLGVSFRVVSEPSTPRGDVARIHPPRVIKRRLEQLPGASKEGIKKEVSSYVNGKNTLLPRVSRLSMYKWSLVTRPKLKIQDWYNRVRS